MITSPAKSLTEDASKVDQVNKLPLKRFQLALHKFADIALPLHLETLKKQNLNILIYKKNENWDQVHKEQVNASRTIQQLTADIWEVERLRNKIRDEDILEFDKKVDPLKSQILETVSKFLSDHERTNLPSPIIRRQQNIFNDNAESGEKNENGEVPQSDLECQLQVNKEDETQPEEEIIRNNKSLLASCKNLYRDLIDLNKLIHHFSQAVHSQQTQIDQIQDHLEETEENVHEGTKQLGKAVKYKTVLYPITGALIGCCAGPVGLVVGIKAGIAAAVGGSLLGYMSGKYIKKRNEGVVENTEIEMGDLPKSKSMSDVVASGSGRIGTELSKNGLTLSESNWTIADSSKSKTSNRRTSFPVKL